MYCVVVPFDGAQVAHPVQGAISAVEGMVRLTGAVAVLSRYRPLAGSPGP